MTPPLRSVGAGKAKTGRFHRHFAWVAAHGVLLASLGVISVGAGAATGCSPPHPARQVATKEIPVDVKLGKGKPPPTTVPPPPPAPNPESAGFPGFVQPPPPLPHVVHEQQTVVINALPPISPAPPPPTCRPPDYLAAPKNEATPRAPLPPKEGSYPFRNGGQYTAQGTTAPIPEYSTRDIRAVQVDVPPQPSPTGGDPYSTYHFDVAALLGPTSTITTYRVVSNAADACVPNPDQPNPLGGQFCNYSSPAGIYITKVVTLHADGSTDTFEPAAPGLLIAEFALQEGITWHSDAVDAERQVQMSVDGVVKGRPDAKNRVYACDKPLDSWEVDITNGTITTPSENITFTARYFIGTQYGALSLAEEIHQQGTQDGQPLKIDNRSSIMTEPALAGTS